MSQFGLAFLGTPEVRHAGHLLTFRSRKALGILIYLVAAGGKHSREKLTALFWPESDENAGRASLRTTLTYLRNTQPEPIDAQHFIIERDTIGFDYTSAFDLDLRTLEAAFLLTRTGTGEPEGIQGRGTFPRPSERDERHHLLSLLQQAASCYRGPFLEGFSIEDAPDFDDWMRLQREVCHQRMSTVFDRLSQLQSDGGEFYRAIDTATRWIMHDALHETAHQRLMQMYIAIGDRSNALRAYEACQSILEEQLHTHPSPETQALAERLRVIGPRSTTSQGARDALLTKSAAGAANRRSEPPSFPDTPLAGRAGEFAQLIESYHAILQGASRIMILQGEAGIGKTRLANEFLGWAAAHGADVLSGRVFETGGRLPYQPLVEALRNRIERENAPDDLLSDTWLAELSRLLPELRDRYPDLPLPTLDETTARIRLFEAITRLLETLATRAPVVFFIDDVQWIDAASLDVLSYAARNWTERGSPILLLLTARTEALSTTAAFSRWLASLEHKLKVTNLELGPLTQGDVAQVIAALHNNEPVSSAFACSSEEQETQERTRRFAAFSKWLYTETGGQPFYLTETLKALLERGLLALKPSNSKAQKWTIDLSAASDNAALLRGFLPPGVRQVIRSRLEQLSSEGFTLLMAGAVLGQGFTFELLCQVANLTESDALTALDETLRGRLLFEEDTASQGFTGSYFFTHDKIRDVAYTEAGEARRRIFHRRAFETLQALQRSPAELAHHAEVAGLLEASFHYSLLAGDEAMHLLAVRDAIPQYERALSLAASSPGRAAPPGEAPLKEDLSAMQHLYTQLGHAYELNNEVEQADSTYSTMLKFAQDAHRATMECAALNLQAALYARNGYHLEEATTLLHSAWKIAERAGDTVGLVETEWNLTQLSGYLFDPAAALAHGEQALALARQSEQKELLARCLHVLAYAHMEPGHWAEAEPYAQEARSLYHELHNRAMEVDTLSLGAIAQINNGQPLAGMQTARIAHAISQEIGYAWGQVNSALPLAMGSLEVGAFTDALTFAEQAETISVITGQLLLLGVSLTLKGMAYRTVLNLEAARAAHLEVLPWFEETGLQPLIEMVVGELCTDCALAGNWEEAYTYALQAVRARSDTFLFSTQLTFWYQIEALVRANEVERAAGEVQRFGERIGSSRRYRIPYLRAMAVLAKEQGEYDKTIGYLQEAATLAEEMGLPGEWWSILAEQGVLYVKQGEQEQARRAFEQAAAIVQRLADMIRDQGQRAKFLTEGNFLQDR
jgi:DNA-binding SARP family transcriptional activator/tetratricopeptide (TPR) repeat protein